MMSAVSNLRRLYHILIASHILLLHYVFSAACLGKSVCQDMWKRAVNNLVVRPAGVAAAAGAPPVELNVNIPPLPAVFQTQPAANPKLNHLEWTSFNGNFSFFVCLFVRFLRAGKYILH